MSALAGFSGLFVKEVKELTREKRLVAILVVLGGALTVPFFFFLSSVLRYGDFVPSPDDLITPLVYMLPIALILTALTFAADCVSKEKDSGMLGLVLSSPVTTESFLLAKLAGTFVVYGAVALFTLAFAGVLALGFGAVVMKIVLWFFLVPFLALWIFLVGLGLLVSVTMNGSKSAVGVGIAVYLPLFLLIPSFLGELIRMVAPTIASYLEYNPIAMAIATASQLSYGAPFSWLPVFVSIGLGVGLAFLAYVLFRRQEVPQ